MFQWLWTRVNRFLERQRLARDIEPEAFRSLTNELRELARQAGALWPPEHQQQATIARIRFEMEQLEAFASSPEFRHLEPEKRLELRRSLQQSRRQLIETVHAAPSPTNTLQ
ncbi:MAG: hypothetical protein AB7E47_14490 [Desulfovibrionaceae bacterium]